MTTIQRTYRLNGTNTELPDWMVPEDTWTGSVNMVSRAGLMQVKPKFELVQPTGLVRPTVAIEAAVPSSFTAATGVIFYGGSNGGGTPTDSYVAKVHTTDTSTSTNRTPGGWSGAAATHIWSAARLNQGCWIINTSAEVPVYWSGAACAVMPNWGPSGSANDRAQTIRTFREFAIALGLYNGTTTTFEMDTVCWSNAAGAAAVPSTWVPAAGNLAGYKYLQGDGGFIQDGLQLGDAFYVYKTQAVWRMDRVNDNEVFGVRKVFDGFGAFGPNCVASDGTYHYVFTGTDVVRHNGQQWESLCSNTHRAYLATAKGYNRSSFVFYDPLRHDVYVCFTDAVSTYYATKCLVINTVTGAQYERDPPGTNISSMFLTRDLGAYLWGCNIAGTQFTQIEGGSAASVTASVTRTGLMLDAEKRTIIDWIRPRIKTAGAITATVTTYSRPEPDDSDTAGTAQSFATASSDRVNIPNGIPGRYHGVAIEVASSVVWSIEGFDVGYRVAGGF